MEATSNQGIHAKLLEFQKLQISIKKDANNPHFKSKYADLSEVIGKVRPALNQVGIILIQEPTETGLKTSLIDPDTDTSITGYLPFINASDPQKLGSNITYLRRYSLVTMLGLEDADDDATSATEAQKPAPKAVPPKKVVITQQQAMEMLAKAENQEQLKKVWVSLSTALKKDPEVEAMKDERKEFLTNQETA